MLVVVSIVPLLLSFGVILWTRETSEATLVGANHSDLGTRNGALEGAKGISSWSVCGC